MTPAMTYLRVSGRGQVEGDGFPRQLAACDAHAAAHGLRIDRAFMEEGVTGKAGEEDRPAFQSMIAAMLEHGVTVILVESLDRLARQYDIQQQLATYIASKGLTLISANTGEDITAALMGDPMRRAMIQIQGVFAELDKNLTVAKLRKARERKRARTGRCEGLIPYGRDEAERHVISEAMRLRAAGLRFADIADEFNRRAIPAYSGGPWHGGSLSRIVARQTPCAQIALLAS